jgi:putative ATP-dependent endonuclease of OLD family
MHDEKGFEDLILKNTSEAALRRFVKAVKWPPHLVREFPDPEANTEQALRALFDRRKGDAGVADFLVQCTEAEIPEWVRESCIRLQEACVPLDSVDGVQPEQAE